MQEKKIIIIERATEIIAKKGYHAASIQEIAEASKLSKGAFYSYFKSKDELLAEIVRYHFRLISEEIEKVDEQVMHNSRDKAKLKLATIMREMVKRGNFIVMQRHEIDSDIGKEMELFFLEVRETGRRKTELDLLDVYGDASKPYLKDLRILLEGMLYQFIGDMLLDGLLLDLDRTAAYILERMDDMVAGLLKRKSEPLVTEDTPVASSVFEKELREQEVMQVLHRMQAVILKLGPEHSELEELQGVVELIQEEMRGKEPKKLLIQGLLANFKGISELESLRTELAQLLDIKVL
ncbi:TetR/AcrR family transcriptional regulator [Terribacillus sp. DMT04]|uniref:TetR/AcrR family transcriptional regulator n=1 Tax=Terribacillus sp. DMT04 TaxID=2850441 RepID=UPI001C2C1444|nr:TetR/AcrR family transcriptional regulator [Terribacillus sp. DMT04]QXE01028.1 TetR/AcrR family transcriptional regulator; helix-turn-helix transcriptional regulator [Terribacillus sp. DMT04]